MRIDDRLVLVRVLDLLVVPMLVLVAWVDIVGAVAVVLLAVDLLRSIAVMVSSQSMMTPASMVSPMVPCMSKPMLSVVMTCTSIPGYGIL